MAFPALAIAVVLGSCATARKTRPAPAALTRTLPALPESHINIPVKIVMPPILLKAAQLMPKQVTSTGWPRYLQSSCDFHYKYRFVPGNFSFNCTNNQVQVRLGGTYQVAGEKSVCAFGRQVSPWIGGSCGFGQEPMRKTDIYIGSSIRFMPNYTVRINTRTQQVIAMEKCTVTAFNMDITRQVMDSIRSSTDAYCYSIDSLINGLDFSSTTRSLADRINKKIPVARYGYLKINPSAIKMGPMNYASDTLQATMGISCFPELESDSTDHFTASYLPPLQGGVAGQGISLYTNAKYDYAFINTLLNQTIKDTVFQVEGRKVVLKNVAVSGNDNGKLEINIDFEGEKKGNLYLEGTPQLDTAGQVITLPDLDYSLKSSDLALNLGKTLFGNKILRMLRDKATIRIKDLVEQNRKSIDAQLNRKIMEGVLSTGSLLDLHVLAIVVGKASLQAQTRATANATIIITHL